MYQHGRDDAATGTATPTWVHGHTYAGAYWQGYSQAKSACYCPDPAIHSWTGNCSRCGHRPIGDK